MHTYLPIYTYTHIHILTPTYHIHILTPTYTHIYILTYIHIHINT